MMKKQAKKYEPKPEPVISYSQNHEDVYLFRIFGRKREGYYVDVGAQLPEENSVTRLFYEKGWRGINIEPNPTAFIELNKQRERDINLRVGVSDKSGTDTYYYCREKPGWSTFSREEVKDGKRNGLSYEIMEVEVVSLVELFGRYKVKKIDFLKIDVEGYEDKVIKGNNWKRFRPIVVVIETNHSMDWESYFTKQGYKAMLYDGINTYYLRRESPEYEDLMRVPVNVLDNYIDQAYIRESLRVQKELDDRASGLNQQLAKIQKSWWVKLGLKLRLV